MSILFQRILPFASITLAVGVLSILIAVSTSPAGEVFRVVDARAQYLSDVAFGLDQQLNDTASSASDDRIAAIVALAETLPESVDNIRGSLSRLQTPTGWLEQGRGFSVVAFNLIDSEEFQIADPVRYEQPLENLSLAADLVSRHIDVFLGNRAEFEAGLARFSHQVRELVQQLRATGRDDLADQIFRAGNQIQAYTVSGEAPRLTQVETIEKRLELAVAVLGEAERDSGTALLETSPLLVDARRAMNQSLRQMDLPGLADAIAAFRGVATDDRVRALSMISDARVLLNLYTVFLLLMLGYLGLRLRSSYAALNQSHDDLEARVHERTSDLELAYEELKESQVQLVQAEKMSSLGQLVAGVMHEINTPLLYVLNNASITSEVIAELNCFVEASVPLLEAKSSDEVKIRLTELLKRRAEFDAVSIRESAAEVASLNQDSIEGLNQISELVQSLKDFSRLDRATEDRFDVCEGIEKTLTITRNLLKYGIEVEKDFEPVGEIFCSPARINQIFVNLVTNAAQAMDGEGTLRIGVRSAGDGVEIRFEDTGCGIAKENLSRITDPFFTTKPVGEGTGLGLSIVHQIVQQHHGSLDIESEVGKGTCIRVRLPRQPYDDKEAA